jgi:subtilisin family serine protease
MRRRSAALLLLLVCLAGLPVPVAARSGAVTGSVASDGRYLVALRAGAVGPSVVTGADVVRRGVGRMVVVAGKGHSRAVRDRLAADPRVAAVLPDAILRPVDWPADGNPSDPGFRAQWGLGATNVPAVWPVTTGTRTTVVAMIDTGLTLDHGELSGLHVVAPVDIVNGATSIDDETDHGNLTTSLVAATANDGFGIPGIAPGVSIMPIRAVDDGGLSHLSWLLDGIDWAVAHGASVVNISMAGDLSPAYQAVTDPVTRRATDAGTLIVAASGNGGLDDRQSVFPCAGQDVLCASGTTAAGERGSFSNAGPIVDIAAPADRIPAVTGGGDWELLSGTSFAAPHVSGIAALLRSAHPGATARETARAIVESATDLGAAGRDDAFGAGLVDAAAALDRLAAIVADRGAKDSSGAPRPSVPFAAAILRPAAFDERWEVGSYTVAWAATSPAATATLVDEVADPVSGRCPASADWRDSTRRRLDRSVVTVRASTNRCHRFRVEAADAGGDSAVSPPSRPILLHNEAPSIIARSPAPGSRAADRDAPVRIDASEPLLGIGTRTVVLLNTRTGNRVAATVRWDARRDRIVLDPASRLRAWTTYTVVLRAGITDEAWTSLRPRSWTYRTGGA